MIADKLRRKGVYKYMVAMRHVKKEDAEDKIMARHTEQYTTAVCLRW